jgi:predicted ATP-grasp superfamily ATP-dependent carboligase
LVNMVSAHDPERMSRRDAPARAGAGGSTGRPVALVLGSGALEVIRALRLAGIRCAVVTAPGDPASGAAKTRSLFTWDWSMSERAHDGALTNRLLAWAWTQPEAPTLFYSCDQALLFVSRQRDQLARGFRFVVPDADLVEALADSARFAALADRVGLPVPESRPVPGHESAIESYHVYVDHTGDIAAEFTGTKVRTWPLECGSTTACGIGHREDLAQLGHELVRLLDFRGIAKFDFRRGPDGALQLLEINARPGLWHHPGARAGINIPATVYADLTGLPRRWFAARARARASWPWRDAQVALRSALSECARVIATGRSHGGAGSRR